jgi:hypothetical protein
MKTNKFLLLALAAIPCSHHVKVMTTLTIFRILKQKEITPGGSLF